MTGTLDGLLRAMAVLVELVATGVGNAPLPILLGVAGLAGFTAVGVLALAVRALAASVRTTECTPGGTARERADLRVLVTQSDPDAAGHVRSRAPGRGSWSSLPAAT